jgi:hypothetical protein
MILEYESIGFFWNIGDSSPNDTASHFSNTWIPAAMFCFSLTPQVS